MDRKTEPQWLTHYPVQPSFILQWVVIGLAIFAGALACIAMSPTALVIVASGILLGVLGITCVASFIAAYGIGSTTQICPRCHRSRPTGYDRCPCGFVVSV